MTRVLHLYGGWPGHVPYTIAEWTRGVLAELSVADVDETTDVFRLDGDLTSYDLIILGWNTVLSTESLTREQEHGLLDAVQAGTGLVAWHGTAASFRASRAFHFMLGGDFIDHPGGDGVRYEVRIVDVEHEVTKGVQDFELSSEQYYLQTDPNIHVLAETSFSGDYLPWIEGHTSPVAWVRQWGAGRVFYHSIGYTTGTLDDPNVRRLTKQGMAWATRTS